jgi:hypothetical protein
MKNDLFYVIASPTLMAMCATIVYFRSETFSPGFTTFVVILSFFLGLTMKTNGERLLSDKLDRMKQELDNERL